MSQNWIDGLYVLVALGFMLMGGVLGYWLGKEKGAQAERQRYAKSQRRARMTRTARANDFSRRG